jgi:hypothetical protein
VAASIAALKEANSVKAFCVLAFTHSPLPILL